LQGLVESHLKLPVIHYFHPLGVYNGLRHILFVTLEATTILRSRFNHAAAFADFLGYDWDKVTGDRDLAVASGDEVEERHEQIAEPRSVEDSEV